jgi:hypothetical protein
MATITISPRFTKSNPQYRHRPRPTSSPHVRHGWTSLPRGFGADIPRQIPARAYQVPRPAPSAGPRLSSDRGNAERSSLLPQPLACHVALHVRACPAIKSRDECQARCSVCGGIIVLNTPATSPSTFPQIRTGRRRQRRRRPRRTFDARHRRVPMPAVNMLTLTHDSHDGA